MNLKNLKLGQSLILAYDWDFQAAWAELINRVSEYKEYLKKIQADLKQIEDEDVKILRFSEWDKISDEIKKCVKTEKCDALDKKLIQMTFPVNKVSIKCESRGKRLPGYEWPIKSAAKQLNGIIRLIKDLLRDIEMGQFNPDIEKRIMKMIPTMDWTAWASDDVGVGNAHMRRIQELNDLLKQLPPAKAEEIRKKYIEPASKKAHGVTAAKKSVKDGIRQGALNLMASEYNEFPTEFLKLKPEHLIFIHKYPNLDNVKQGMDLLTRAKLVSTTDKSLMAVKCDKPVKKDEHVFLGYAGGKTNIGMGYVHDVEGNTAYIGSMSSRLT